ncbi:MAG: RHS repeat-associated core domain-containing protein [Myxococcaceae bacterium]
MNTGASFRRPRLEKFDATNGPNPSVITKFADGRSVDPGTRAVDLDRDGRTDLVLVTTDEGNRRAGDNSPPRKTPIWLRTTEGTNSNGSTPQFDAHELSMPPSFTLFSPALVDGTNTAGSYGARYTQFGDFNGDGFVDLVSVDATASLGVYLQAPAEPDVIGAISGGPSMPGTSLDYGYANLTNPDLYSTSACIQASAGPADRCLKTLGWAVKSQSTEHFDQSAPGWNTIQYSYSGAHYSPVGRGVIGVEHLTRRLVDAPSGTEFWNETLDFDLATRACGGATIMGSSGPDCLPVQADVPAHRKLAVHVDGSSDRVTESWFNRNVIVDSAIPGYRTDKEVLTTKESEGNQTLSFTRSIATKDEYGNDVELDSETSPEPLPTDTTPATVSTLFRTAQSLSNRESPDTTSWLVSKYRRVTLISTDTTLPASEQSVTRTTALTYEPASVEVKSVTREPDLTVQETDSDSGLQLVTGFTRDVFGNVIAISSTNPLAPSPSTRNTQLDFQNDGDFIFPSRVENTLGHTSFSYRHATWGLAVAEDDPNDVRVTSQYDVLGRLRTVQPAGGALATVTYLNQQNPLTGTRGRGWTECSFSTATGTSCVVFNPAHQAVARSWPAFVAATSATGASYQLDRFGRVVTQTLPTNQFAKIEYQRDGLGRATRVQRPSDTSQSLPYVSKQAFAGRTVTSTSERGLVTTAAFDAKGRLVAHSAQDPDDQSHIVTTSYSYWHFDLPRVIAHPVLPSSQAMVPSPGNLSSSMSYDAYGRLHTLDDPDIGHLVSNYNAFDELKRAVDNTGSATTYQRDDLGRITAVVTPADATYAAAPGATEAQHATFEFDTAANGIGKIARTTSADGVVTSYGYDTNGRLSSYELTESGNTYDFGLSYNPNGQLLQLDYPTLPGGLPFGLHFDYGGNGDVAAATEVSSTTFGRLLWSQISETPLGQTEDEQFGTAASSHRSYDALGRVRLITTKSLANNSAFQTLGYKWGADDMLLERDDGQNGSSETFHHDFLGRLDDWKVLQNCTGAEWTYSYDDWGNLRKRAGTFAATGGNQTAQTTDYAYTSPGDLSAPHALKSAVTAGSVAEAYQYDAAGQMRVGRDNTFTWTPLGLPRSVQNAAATSNYTFDASGSRVVETKQTASAIRRTVTIGGLFEVHTDSSTLQGEVVYDVPGNNGVVAQVRRQMGGSEEVRYFHADSLGSPDVVTSETAPGQLQVLERTKYEPFGERRYPWALGQPFNATSSARQTQGFTGQQPDDSFGLINMRGRIYDPHAAHFVSADPIAGALSQQLNRFSYVRNSPLMLTDPTGWNAEGDSRDTPSNEQVFETGLVIRGTASNTQAPPPKLQTPNSDDAPRVEVVGDVPPPQVSLAGQSRPAQLLGETAQMDLLNPYIKLKYDNIEIAERARSLNGQHRALPELPPGITLDQNPAIRLRIPGTGYEHPDERFHRIFMQRFDRDVQIGMILGGAAIEPLWGVEEAALAAGTAGGGGGAGETVLYRLITEEEPAANFLSNAAKGLAARGPELKNPAIHRGISTFNSLEKAVEKIPVLERGGHTVYGVAELRIPASAIDVSVAKTLGPGHYTVTGAAEEIMAYWRASWIR